MFEAVPPATRRTPGTQTAGRTRAAATATDPTRTVPAGFSGEVGASIAKAPWWAVRTAALGKVEEGEERRREHHERQPPPVDVELRGRERGGGHRGDIGANAPEPEEASCTVRV